MPLRAALWFLFVCSVAGVVIPGALGATYVARIAARPSFYPVSVSDAGPPPPSPSAERPHPRRAAVVVLDGLGHEDASRMRFVARMRQLGQCRRMDVGALPMSRPVYGALSTGVEQDRGGALINDSTAPHAAESIWEVARRAGLSVTAVSELPWWRQLFPRGFTSYAVSPRDADYFRLPPPADLTLVHPLYLDETGHEHGAASAEYRGAMARADTELAAFMDTLDPARDLLVVTADHGHSLRGGHGGRQPRVAEVLTCYAGPGVQHRAEIGAMRVTTFAPALSLLLGLPFPSGMRAGDDDLDTLWEIADQGAFSPGYVADRRAAVERFRAENRAAVATFLPASAGSWTALHHAARHAQALRALPFLAVLITVLWAHRLGHRRLAGAAKSGAWFGLGWILASALSAYALQTWLRGSFDMSSVGTRFGFLCFTPLLGAGVISGGAALHLRLRRSPAALAWDASFFSLVGTLLAAAHPAVLGAHLDYPVPPPPLYFFPLFATLFLAATNALGMVFCAVDWFRRAPRPELARAG